MFATQHFKGKSGTVEEIGAVKTSFRPADEVALLKI